jgi:diguanylate cyclase (GGDEF)-like protein
VRGRLAGDSDAVHSCIGADLAELASRSLLRGLLGLLCVLCCAGIQAAPTLLPGSWEAMTPAGKGIALDQLPLDGGRFRHESPLDHPGGTLVIDFRSSSVIGRFEHRVYADGGAQVARVEGGIESPATNPFFLRHGRELTLPAGHYTVVTEVASPFFLAQPQPFVDSLDDYRLAINRGNALVLVCLGIFVGLGVYYACLALMRRRRVHAMYALFICGNLLYNGAALLVWHDLGAPGWFYLISVPILFSNIAYIVFVVDLLEIRAAGSPSLLLASRTIMVVMAGFIAVAAAWPHWSLLFDRAGVAMFLLFGFVAGIVRARQGSTTAKLYLVANIGFFASGFASITLSGVAGVFFTYVEHLGLVAVTIEVLMLAIVLSYQFGRLQQEKDDALRHAERSLQLASTDVLTGLPNRYAFEQAAGALPADAGLTFIDLDGLKHYNDTFGHARGDDLLCEFARQLGGRVTGRATLHRLGGDEFVVTIVDGDVDWVEAQLARTMVALQDSDFRATGASAGSVRLRESAHVQQAKAIADSRMYENKRLRRKPGESSVLGELN